MRIYIGKIKKIEPHQVFVFGSNTQGRHGKGAALFAKEHCGAIYGRAKGLMNNCYGIVTKDLTKVIHPSISKEYIIQQIRELYSCARICSGMDFIVAYSTEPNLNGYSPQDMAWCFRRAGQNIGDLGKVMIDGKLDNLIDLHIPHNIIFEENFYKLVFNLEQNHILAAQKDEKVEKVN